MTEAPEAPEAPDAHVFRSLPVDDDGVFMFSASSISTDQDCSLKWWFNYCDGRRSEGNAASVRGSKIHAEMESWLGKGQVPSDPAAKRLLPLAPLPTHNGLLIEHPFRILFPTGVARGFIDVLIPVPEKKKLAQTVGPAWCADIPIVIDWKSTARMEYAKTSEDLYTDPQSILYGVEARRHVAKQRGCLTKEVELVDLNWCYTGTKQAKTAPVRLRQSLQILEDGLGPLLDTTRKMAANLGATKPGDVDYDLRGCAKYGGCPHREYCPAHQAYSNGSAFDTAFRNVPEATASDAGTQPTENKKMATLLEKLAAAKKTAPKPAVLPAGVKPVVDETPVATTTKASPEPSIPKADVSGLDKPIPKGTAPVVPPDAAPDVSPEDPPEPLTPDEVVEASPAKRKPGRPAKVTTTGSVASQPANDSVTVRVLTDSTPVSLEAFIRGIAQTALDKGELEVALDAASLLVQLQRGG